MLYMMWAVWGFMCLDLLIGLVRSFWAGTFSVIPKMVLDLLKDSELERLQKWLEYEKAKRLDDE